LDFAITGNNKKQKQILVIENNSNGQWLLTATNKIGRGG
jgi:hypothetical protein